MNIAFVTGTLKRGGAQKMLTFVMNTLATVPTVNIQVILTDENVVSYSLPKNSQVISMPDMEKKSKGGVYSKIDGVITKSKFVRKVFKDSKTDLVYAFGPYYALLSIIAARKLRIKIIASERRAPQDLSILWKKLSKWTYSQCDGLVFQLEGARDFFGKKICEKSQIIPNPYVGEPREACPFEKRQKNIVMAAARIEREKGFDIGIKAMIDLHPEFPEYVMDIYGGGEGLEQCQKMVDEANASEYIRFHAVSSNIEDVVWDAGVFLLPSRVEGIPNMLMEVLGLGVPTVAADCIPGGAKLLVGENRGLIVDVDNVEQMAAAIKKIINSPQLAEELSCNAQDVCHIFESQKIAKMWIDNLNKYI